MFFREESAQKSFQAAERKRVKKTYYFHEITMKEFTDNCFSKDHNGSAKVNCYDFDSALIAFRHFAISQYIHNDYIRETDDFNLWRLGESRSDISKIVRVFSVCDKIYVLSKEKYEYRCIIF